MPEYNYKAAKLQGDIVQGVLAADTEAGVIEQLQAQQLVPIQILQQGSSSAPWLRLGSRFSRIPLAELNAFTQAFATLLQAGIPLEKTLGLLATINDNSKVRKALQQVLTQVRAGASLGDALSGQPGVFSPLYISLVRAGEASGALERVLAHLARYLERSKWLHDTLISALIYPVILACVALASVLLLLTFVVPQFEQLFEGVEHLLPLSTRITIAAGDWVVDYAWLVIATGGLTLIGWRYGMQASRGFRYRCHRQLWRLPLVGPLVAKVETARLCRMLGILLSSGVPLLKALVIVRDTQRSEVLRQGLEQVNGEVAQGQRLSAAVSRLQLLPALALNMLQVGEESGELEPMLEKVADWYDQDVEASLKRLLAMIEPLLILVLGGVIAWVVISILLAMLSVNELAF
ncbi:MAG: type II secretion system F family protein [Motiliproteus sp.]